MKAQFIINDPPYGSERIYHALSLDRSSAKRGVVTGMSHHHTGVYRAARPEMLT
jgi:sulfur relay (sulfurtransferase) complex TusBCD TusD component (DsrE family)